MFLTGLPLSTLLLIGGLVSSLTVLLYVLKLRRRPIAVPFARIWTSILKDQQATSWFSRLRRLLSLLLQLVLLGLIVLALGNPKLDRVRETGREVVVLVDTSASMKASDVLPSRLDVAQGKVRELISGLGASDRLLIAGLDVSVTPYSTLTSNRSELEKANLSLTATDTAADVRRGLEFALDTLRGASNPEIVLVSDGAFADWDARTQGLDLGGVHLRYVPVGTSGKNVAITQFSVRRYPLDKARSEVLLEVTNTNDEPVDVELTLLGDGEILDVTRLRLGPKEQLPRFYQDLRGASRTLEATLSLSEGARDDLGADDHAYALMPEKRRARVLVVTEGNTYLEAALLLDEYLDVTLIASGDPAPSGPFDVAIFDGVGSDAAPRFGHLAAAHFFINPPAEGAPVRLGKALKMFGFDTWDKKSPLLRHAAMGDIQVLTGTALVPQADDKVLGASLEGPILVSGRRQNKPFVALGFDPRQSDFVLRVAWPLFVLGAINQFVEEDARYLSSYRTGEVWHVPGPSGVLAGELEGPTGEKKAVPVADGHAVYLGDRAGFYKLAFDTGTEKLMTAFAANLSDLRESEIRPKLELALGGQKLENVSGFEPTEQRELWVYLLLAAAALSFLEWFTYHRRWTV